MHRNKFQSNLSLILMTKSTKQNNKMGAWINEYMNDIKTPEWIIKEIWWTENVTWLRPTDLQNIFSSVHINTLPGSKSKQGHKVPIQAFNIPLQTVNKIKHRHVHKDRGSIKAEQKPFIHLVCIKADSNVHPCFEWQFI